MTQRKGTARRTHEPSVDARLRSELLNEELSVDVSSGAKRTSGTLSNAEDDELPVAEPGSPVNPEDLGVQFLRDATEQGNFESQVEYQEDEPGAYSMGQLISDATLEHAQQAGAELPSSRALDTIPQDDVDEGDADEVDLTHNAIRGASLFDHAKDSNDPFSQPTREPALDTDESADFDEHRPAPGTKASDSEEERARMRAALRKNPDRRDVAAFRETWQDNRHSDGSGGDGATGGSRRSAR